MLHGNPSLCILGTSPSQLLGLGRILPNKQFRQLKCQAIFTLQRGVSGDKCGDGGSSVCGDEIFTGEASSIYGEIKYASARKRADRLLKLRLD